MNTLDDMRMLVEVVDRGAFTEAARRLGMSKQLVSRRIMALEDRLGVQLLTRTTRRLTPTEAGREYAERARRILADVAEADMIVGGRNPEPRGLLRVSAPLSFGISHLSPILTGFKSVHPAVEIDVDLSDRPVDLVAEGYDVAVRIGVLKDSSLIARKLMEVRFAVCGSPDYLRRRGVPQTLADLKDHECLAYRHSAGLAWTFGSADRIESEAVSGSFRANNGEVLRDAAIAGLGLAQLPTFIVSGPLADGSLIRVLDAAPMPTGAVYAVHPAHRQRSVTVRAFTDYLVAALAT